MNSISNDKGDVLADYLLRESKASTQRARFMIAYYIGCFCSYEYYLKHKHKISRYYVKHPNEITKYLPKNTFYCDYIVFTAIQLYQNNEFVHGATKIIMSIVECNKLRRFFRSNLELKMLVKEAICLNRNYVCTYKKVFVNEDSYRDHTEVILRVLTIEDYINNINQRFVHYSEIFETLYLNPLLCFEDKLKILKLAVERIKK